MNDRSRAIERVYTLERDNAVINEQIREIVARFDAGERRKA